MAYRFTGFFARLMIDAPPALPTGAVWRVVTDPFDGVGVRLPDGIEEGHRLRHEVGLSAAEGWLFLEYACWGGRIDYVHGRGVRGGREFGPIREDRDAKAAFLFLMRSFGIEDADALDFAPFHRGFWGEG